MQDYRAINKEDPKGGVGVVRVESVTFIELQIAPLRNKVV